MSVLCPNGHPSETADYCDQCGAKIQGAPVAAAAGPAAGAPPTTTMAPASPPPLEGAPPQAAPPPAGEPAPAAAEALCPVCQAPRVGDDRFCEGCGYDFTSPPPAVATDDGATAAGAWEAEVTADRDYYERMEPEGVPFPLHCPPRRFVLAGPEVRIGRRSASRGIQPEIDLSGAPEDSAISHLHCLLIEQPDGSYSLVDPGSTNGTTLNDDTTPLTANTAVALTDGDRIHLGAWTTITVHRRPATP
ncbi:MAG TPA: FHA domain-containing protein [Acidimicrobiales bacterium]|nr:FHA domain-containing protein [Acidimicrobiales bacterium]